MQCEVCGVRSSVGYCEECKKLLCEEHAIKCEKCAKTICPDHVHLTSSGRQLCGSCYEARKAAKSERRKEHSHEGEAAAAATTGGTGLQDLRDEEEEGLEQEALVGSVQEFAPPWRLSIITAILAVVVALALLVFPGLRRFDIGGGNVMSTPWVLMIIPVFATFWGIAALLSFRYEDKRLISLAGIGLSVIAAVLLVVAVQTDPARALERAEQEQQESLQNMTPEELEQRRIERLMRYSPQQPQAPQTPPAAPQTPPAAPPAQQP